MAVCVGATPDYRVWSNCIYVKNNDNKGQNMEEEHTETFCEDKQHKGQKKAEDKQEEGGSEDILCHMSGMNMYFM